jgi:hypothetical protein
MSDTPNNTDDEVRTTVTIRRAPKFSVFVVVGALVGFLVTLVLTSLYPADPAVGFAATLGFLSLFGIPLGGIMGAAIAIAFDYRASRRASTVIAGKLAVRANELAQPDENSSDHSAERSDG